MSQHAKDLARATAAAFVALAQAVQDVPSLVSDVIAIQNGLVGPGPIEVNAAKAVRGVNAILDHLGLSAAAREAAFDLRAKLRALALIAEVDEVVDAYDPVIILVVDGK